MTHVRQNSWRMAAVLVLLAVSATQRALGNGRFPAANQLVVDANDSRHIVVRSTFGLLQTLDGGRRWSWICESAITGSNFLDPPLAIGARSQILLGLDDGVHAGSGSACQWQSASANFSGDEVIDLAGESNRIFAALLTRVDGAVHARVALSIDGGSHFATVGSLLDDASPVTIEVAPSLGSRVYLGMLDGNLEKGLIARSDDGGSTWLRLPAPNGPDSVYISAVDPYDPNRLYVRSSFPTNSLLVSADAGASWSTIYDSKGKLTGFALSPDGQRLAVGGADGLAVLDTTAPSKSPYPVLATYSTPVNCLTWHATGLYACSTDANGGFAVGVSADARSAFSSLLHFADLEPLACPDSAGFLQCASAPCLIGDLFDAGCGVSSAPAIDAGASSPRPAPFPASTAHTGGCSIPPGTEKSGCASGFVALLGVLFARRRRTSR